MRDVIDVIIKNIIIKNKLKFEYIYIIEKAYREREILQNIEKNNGNIYT